MRKAIQIIIGCMHLGFGIILGLMNVIYLGVAGFGSTAFVGGYPFWGGISIKGSLGMNIVSAIFTAVGLILLLLDMSLNGSYGQDYWALIAGKGISAMLMIFSLLEISIACATAHFARKIIANPNRIKGSLGMNIVSAIFTLPGVILLLLDMILNNQFTINYWALVSGSGISAMLLIFSLLEFCIACATAHFASKILANTSRDAELQGQSNMAEVEETLTLLQSQKRVQGIIVVNTEGIPIKSTMDNPTTTQYTNLMHNFILKAQSTMHEINPPNILNFLRIHSKKNEIMVAPDKDYYLIVIQNPTEQATLGSLCHFLI
ncbi:Dynein light chain roadblock-type 1 [Tupaia chinensis]|uniref:Dynein light chain roadblock-type 1 n=1 Tax=Tupaia chinensis TaxID=246437 RepID=L8Y144_TUPCH|nr:Dynein light chain roadblock-type 1 [Tupaia chinensis]